MNKSVSIKFVDFWSTFNALDNKIVEALSCGRQVSVIPADSDEVPDILFYSRYGFSHYKYDCCKIYFSGENDFPNLNECDYSISFYPYDCGGRNLRYPLYMLYETEEAANPPRLDDNTALGRGFCSLVMRNNTNCDPLRIRIIDRISEIEPLAYGGSFRNNQGGCVDNKIEFISRFRYNLALENSIMPGYVTEKLLEPYAAATVPIYWGDSAATRDFNPESFINVNDFDSLDSLARHIRRLNDNPAEYLRILRAPSNIGENVARLDSQLCEFLGRIADNPARRIAPYGEIHILEERNSMILPLSADKNSRRLLKIIRIFFVK